MPCLMKPMPEHLMCSSRPTPRTIAITFPMSYMRKPSAIRAECSKIKILPDYGRYLVSILALYCLYIASLSFFVTLKIFYF